MFHIDPMCEIFCLPHIASSMVTLYEVLNSKLDANYDPADTDTSKYHINYVNFMKGNNENTVSSLIVSHQLLVFVGFTQLTAKRQGRFLVVIEGKQAKCLFEQPSLRFLFQQLGP